MATTPPLTFEANVEAKEPLTVSVTEIPAQNPHSEGIEPDKSLVQSFTFSIEDDESELSSSYTNEEEDLSVPREIISSAISSTILQSECRRPIIAGTYNDEPAFLLKLQFQFIVPGSDHSWLSRIRSATISVILEDAPAEAELADQPKLKRKGARQHREKNHPSIPRAYPGPEGWEGPISTEVVSTEFGTGLQAGWQGIGANAHWNQTRSKDEKGTVTVKTMITGQRRNQLLVAVKENPVDAYGIPSFLVVPLVVTHTSRRFSMRVNVRATYGFWRGKLAEMVPILGRTDEPLFFDPKVLAQKMESKEKGVGGINVVEGVKSLDNIDLRLHTSLRSAL